MNSAMRRAPSIAFLLLLTAYVGWIVSLPAWPSQDGPVHLYYTQVLQTLFAGSPTVYGPFLYIKHLLPPYAVYYYTLLLLAKAVSLATADRLVICGYMICFAFGFRYAARAVGPSADRTSALACALLLNWCLGMGFVNYCLSLAFALWGIGLWLRLTSAPQLGRRCAFVALLGLVTLSHPVPLLIVLSFAGVDLLCRAFFAGGKSPRSAVLRHLLPNLITWGAGALCLLYVKAFTVEHPLEQRTVVKGGPAHQVLQRVLEIATAKSLCLLYGHWSLVLLYRAGLVLLLAFTAIAAVLHFRKNRIPGCWTASKTCVIFLAVIAIALPLLPSDLSGAYFFSQRLTLLLWVAALLAASVWKPAARLAARVDLIVAGYAVALSFLLLFLADAGLRPIAARQRLLNMAAVPSLNRQRVLVLAGNGHVGDFARLAPAWNPFQWDAVALLRHNQGVLENAPWLDSPIIPLAPTPALRGARLPPLLANSPFELTLALARNPGLQAHFFRGSDMVLFSPAATRPTGSLTELLGRDGNCSEVRDLQVLLCQISATRTAGQTSVPH